MVTGFRQTAVSLSPGGGSAMVTGFRQTAVSLSPGGGGGVFSHGDRV